MGISQEQARDCFASGDLIGIGMEADQVRRTLHPEGVVSYAVERVVAISQPAESLHRSIDGAAGEAAATLTLKLDRAQTTFAEVVSTLVAIRQQYPSLRLHLLSAGRLASLAAATGLDLGEAFTRLRAAGLHSIYGDGGPEWSAAEWMDLHRAAHRAGLRSVASMVFGAEESIAERVDQLFAIRDLQQETGGFVAFTPRSFLPQTERAQFEEPTAVEYLRTLAVARMVLDGIDNIESSCVAQGLKVAQMGLRFGANDSGSIGSQCNASFTEEDLRRVIRDAGFTPVERDTLYETMFLNN